MLAPSVRLVLITTWFVAPLGRVLLPGLGPSLGLKLVDGFLMLSLVVATLLVARRGDARCYFPRLARRHVLGVTLLAAGVLLGELHSGTGLAAAATAVGYALFGALPLIILLRVRADRRLREQLMMAVIFGTLLSAAVGFAGSTATFGRIIGLSSHMNALAMTIVISMAFLPITFTRSRFRWIWRVAIAGALLVSLNATGSRSGAVALITVCCLGLAFAFMRRRARFGALVLVAAIAVPFIAGFQLSADSSAQDTASRLFGGAVSAENSDSKRTALLEYGVEQLDAETLAFGQGYVLRKQPHNLVLNIAIAGGVLSLTGLYIVFRLPVGTIIKGLISGPFRRAHSECIVISVAICGYLVAAFFNNEIWPRFIWCVLALLVMSVIDQDRRAQADPPLVDDVRSPG